jgi:hypothetical protein
MLDLTLAPGSIIHTYSDRCLVPDPVPGTGLTAAARPW